MDNGKRRKGCYYDLVEGPDGKLNSVRTRADAKEITDELVRSLNHMETEIERLRKENEELRSEAYKDEELRKMKEKLDRMKEEAVYGFPITRKEHERIKAFLKDWNDRHSERLRMKIGGVGWHYMFIPTSVGTSGSIVAPDGEKLEFQEIG